MLYFLGLLPAILFFGIILYAVIDPESVEQAQQRILDQWGETEPESVVTPAHPAAPRRNRPAAFAASPRMHGADPSAPEQLFK